MKSRFRLTNHVQEETLVKKGNKKTFQLQHSWQEKLRSYEEILTGKLLEFSIPKKQALRA